MRKSIRYRLFIGISLFILIIIGTSLVLNTQLLEKYYLDKKKDLLVEYANDINELYNGSINNVVKEKLQALENRMDANFLISSREGQVKYKTYTQNGGMGMNSPWTPSLSKEGVWKVTRGEVIFEFRQHQKVQTDFLVMGYELNNSDIMLLQVPLAAVKETIDVANDFFMYIGIASIAIGMFFSFGFAKQFTRPIIELNHITKGLAELDFSRKSEINTKDEIGELAQNVNYLSSKLDNTITELNQANKKLREDIEKERQIDEMRKKFISNVSHELKTPISLIKGYSEGLKDSVIEDEESKEYYCDVIIDEADKMDKLVKDLLDLSHIESGYFELQEEAFDIGRVVEGILKKYHPILKEKGINLTTRELETIMVKGDPTRIEQVLTNFINNAINHLDENKILEIDVTKENNEAKVSVFNSGRNIPEDELDNLWVSFYKVDKARSRKYGGTGLGLAIVKGILNLHNGEYGVTNKSTGVEFWFKLETYNNIEL